MRWIVFIGLLTGALSACHGQLGDRTEEEEEQLAAFAEARQRAATYYDGGDFERAASQYKEALAIREDHVATRMGYAYSLMFINRPSSLVEAEKQFNEKIGSLRDPKQEVKRIYGLGLTHRSLSAHYERRARVRNQKGDIKTAGEDFANAAKYADAAIKDFKKVIEIDEVLAKDQQLGSGRVSASLTPDAYVGMAHCEIILMRPNPTLDVELKKETEAHLQRADENLEKFAQIAKNARTFWEQKREQILVADPLEQTEPGQRRIDPMNRQRYELKIANTIGEEVAVRRLKMLTLLYLNRYKAAIREATTILRLDPTVDEVLLLRGRAYAWLEPPNYRAAINDLSEYRKRQPLNRLTDELVRINREIRELERRMQADTKG